MNWWQRLWHRHDWSKAEDCGLVADPVERDVKMEKRCSCGLYGYFHDGRLFYTSKVPAQ